MLKSMRRIANTLVAVGVVSLSLSVLSSLVMYCGTGGAGCLAQLVTSYTVINYPVNLAYTQSTPAYVAGAFALEDLNAFVQLTSMYLLLFAVTILVLLECLELHYIRKLFQKRKILGSR